MKDILENPIPFKMASTDSPLSTISTAKFTLAATLKMLQETSEKIYRMLPVSEQIASEAHFHLIAKRFSIKGLPKEFTREQLYHTMRDFITFDNNLSSYELTPEDDERYLGLLDIIQTVLTGDALILKLRMERAEKK